MSLATNISNLATRIATEIKTVSGKIGTLGSLSTTEKTNLVGALNELKGLIDAVSAGSGAISDGTTGTSTTWSSQKISNQISGAVSSLVNGAPGALDTLKELADALGDDASFATTITTALSARVRTDTAAQGLNSTQQGNARTNIGAASSTDMGDPATDFVSTFESGLA